MEQWGIAKAHWSRVTGTEVSPTLSGARELRMWWQTRRFDEPGEVRLADVTPVVDIDWASKMLMAALTEIGP